MIALLCTVAVFAGDAVIWKSTGTGIEKHLTRDLVTVVDDNVYILDPSGSRLLHYNTDAGFVDFVQGGMGQQGFFSKAYRVTHFQDTIFVHEYNRTHLYREDGKFIRSVDPTTRGGNLDKLVNGWLLTAKKYDGTIRNLTLFHGSETLLNKDPLTHWKHDTYAKTSKNPEEQVIGNSYHPAPERGAVAVSRDGKTIFWRDPESNLVKVYDVKAKEVAHVIELPQTSYPVDRAWAEQQFEQHKKELRSIKGLEQLTFYATWPDTFPVVKGLFIGPQGNLIVELWNSEVPHKVEYRAFDVDGNPVQQTWSHRFYERVVYADGDAAYAMTWDDKVGEALVVKVPIDQIESYLKSTSNVKPS